MGTLANLLFYVFAVQKTKFYWNNFGMPKLRLETLIEKLFKMQPSIQSFYVGKEDP